MQFADALLFTDPALVPQAPAGLRVPPLQIASVPAYSEFMLRGLLPYIDTSHLLVVQWDGYLLDASQWDPQCLAFDYIGAPLRHQPPERAVGNGGFSLRSRRLLQALMDPAMVVRHPEDICIYHDNPQRLEQDHDLRFAPPPLAAHFAYERLLPAGPTFGFHGLFNLHRVMAPEALHRLLLELPDALTRGLGAHDLCATLIAAGRLDSAAVLLDKHRRLGLRDRRTLRLRPRLALARWSAQRRRGAPP